MKNFLIIAFTILLNLSPALVQIADAGQRGCCSHHGGVCGCSCCDGKPLSAKCIGYYPECSSLGKKLGINSTSSSKSSGKNKVITRDYSCQTMVVLSNSANLRQQASVQAEILTTLPAKAKLVKTGNFYKDFYEVKTGSHRGWVHKSVCGCL